MVHAFGVIVAGVALLPVAAAPPTPAPDATLTPVTVAVDPVELAFRAGDPAMYVAERRGAVLRVDEGTSTTVLDVADLVSTDGRRGVLGLVFAPDGAHAYLNYTDTDGDPVVTQYAVGPDGAFDHSSARVVISIEQPYPNDRGGHLAFGPDGYLYVGSGDGGGDADPDFAGQSLITMLGKVLRIDPEPSGDLGYTVPEDNPYTGLAGLLDELWSLGLQDPLPVRLRRGYWRPVGRRRRAGGDRGGQRRSSRGRT